MNTRIQTAIVAVVVSVLAVCVFSLRFACTPADLSEVRRHEELEQLRRATYPLLDARKRVARELIDRRCTLTEAIEQFLELDREWPDYHEAVPQVPILGSREERSYRYLRAEVEEILRDRPEQASAVLRRLGLEYEKLQIGRQACSTAAAVQTEQSDSTQEKGGR